MASVQGLEGRWEKLFAILAWRWGKDGFRITRADLNSLPDDRILLVHGHADDIEFRFVTPAEAERIAKWEKENEGKSIVERMTQ